MPAREFSTQRLYLRRWREEDRAAFAAINADPRVMEHFPVPLLRKDSDALADRIATRLDERGWGLWAVEVPKVCPFIGFVGLWIPDHDICASPCVEAGWRLACDYWGKGYATEAAEAVLDFGFGTLALPEIVSFTVPANTRSRALMERIGMRWHGEHFEHPLLPPGHPLRLHMLYRAARAEWLARKDASGPA